MPLLPPGPRDTPCSAGLSRSRPGPVPKRAHRGTLKTLRFVSAPTRSRRLNELLGLVVAVAAVLLLLALVSYTPSDPSFDTVGSYAKGRPAHNWTGLFGAWVADAALQVLGVSVFLLPVLLGRLGVSWMRSQPAGSPVAKVVGVGLWLSFAPAAIALLPGHLLWRHVLPIEGVLGRVVADAMVTYLNLPGACIVVALMVAVSLYLATTFTFNTAWEWTTTRFGFVQRLMDRWTDWRNRRRYAKAEDTLMYESKRERAAAKAQRGGGFAAPERAGSTSLLSGLFGWWARRRGRQDEVVEQPEVAVPAAASIFQRMPRTDVDAPPVTPLGAAAAAAAPYAAALAAAAAPLPEEEGFDLPEHAPSPYALDELVREEQSAAPEPVRVVSRVAPPAPAPVAAYVPPPMPAPAPSAPVACCAVGPGRGEYCVWAQGRCGPEGGRGDDQVGARVQAAAVVAALPERGACGGARGCAARRGKGPGGEVRGVRRRWAGDADQSGAGGDDV